MPRNATLLIWRDRESGGWRYGHLALQLPLDNTGSMLGSVFKNYISWWPAVQTDRLGRAQGKPQSRLEDGRDEVSDTARAPLGFHAVQAAGANIGENRAFAPRAGQVPIEQSQLYQGLSRAQRDLDLEVIRRRPSVMNWEESLMNAATDGVANLPRLADVIYVQEPSETLDIPMHDDTHPGLNEGAMAAWFEAFCQTYHGEWQGRYTFASKTNNCASVVLRALLAGDASFFARLPKRWSSPLGWRSPQGVFEYALRLRDAIGQKANFDAYQHERMNWQGENRRCLYTHAPGQNEEMPSVEEWRTMSRVRAGFTTGLARRKGQVSRIDDRLREYHATRAWGGGDDERRVGLLGDIFEECGSYIRDKQNNRRFGPVLELAQRTLRVLAVRRRPVEAAV